MHGTGLVNYVLQEGIERWLKNSITARLAPDILPYAVSVEEFYIVVPHLFKRDSKYVSHCIVSSPL